MKTPATSAKAGSGAKSPSHSQDQFPKLPYISFDPRSNSQEPNFGSKRISISEIGKLFQPPKIPRYQIRSSARHHLRALVGSGIYQEQRHYDTADAAYWVLSHLRDFALLGDQDAMDCFAGVLSRAVLDFTELSIQAPTVVQKWARKNDMVPAMVGKNPAHRRALEILLESLQLGEESPLRITPKKGKKAPDIGITANHIAITLFEYIEDVRAGCIRLPMARALHQTLVNMPPFSASEAEIWAEAGWQIVLMCTNDQPESNEILKPLGGNVGKKAGLAQARTKAANVRAEIKQTLKESFQKLAPQKSP